MKKIKVGIIGHTGRLGRPLTEIIENHPGAEIVFTESRSEGAHGNLSGAEAVFLALPYGESKKYLPSLGGKKIIDLSIDHRSQAGWTYGLPEIFGAEIGRATKIANPGCYATSIILALYPLRDKMRAVRVAATSGISGAGLAARGEDNFLAYAEGRRHPQIREVELALGARDVLFVPQRIDTANRGIVSTIFLETENPENLPKLYSRIYEKNPFVEIVGSTASVETRDVNGTNICRIKLLRFGGDIVIISALDNLLKGGAGQAIQNFNLMCGFPETLGLI